MRMKEVCERTGLTDRAVRLYIDSGLLTPERVRMYSGRSSIHFSEEDVAVLDSVAVLRKAGFSIADIKRMMDIPCDIPAVIAAHRRALEADIADKKAILATLSGVSTAAASYTEVAEILRASAPPTTIPKEDHSMSIKEITRIIKGRIPSLLALAAMLFGIENLLSLGIRAAFAELTLSSGGGYTIGYASIYEPPFVIFALTPFVLLTAAAVLLLIHIIGGRQKWLIGALICGILSAASFFILPADVAERLYLFEFLDYRYSFMHGILYSTSDGFDLLIKTLKFIPHLIAAALAVVGLVCEKEIAE
ncbi:MAG: MerR family transcriptional regulator [Clostridia bacterium]|nr:MerR family transcriptional regulator [Clostridia bacterium]